jgi:hypothetical protein
MTSTIAPNLPPYGNPSGWGTPPPTGSIVVPQSPSGSISNEAAPFNFDNSITSTRQYLQFGLELETTDLTYNNAVLNAPLTFGPNQNLNSYRWE